MRLALQTESVQRTVLATTRDSRRGVTPSCAGVPSNIIGTCFFLDGPPSGGFNCSACCGLRQATGWAGGAYVVTC